MTAPKEPQPLTRRNAIAALGAGSCALVAGCAPHQVHEAYFGNLGGDGKRSGAIERALAETYGTSTRLEEHFRATGNGLGGGSGWTVLELELQTGELRTTWSGNHTQTLATAYPSLVLDMYEHAYQIDFGAAAAKYIDTFFANIHWDEVNRRLERGVAATKLLRGQETELSR